MSTFATADSSQKPASTLLEPAFRAVAKPRDIDRSDARNEVVDVVRLFAAVAVVFVHSAQSPEFENLRNFFRFAVPFYLFASFYFQSLSLRRHTERTLGQYVYGRFKRLYLPFLAWSAIYLVARNVERIFIFHLGPAKLSAGMFWKGIEYHLWFLPYLLFWSIALAVIHWVVLRNDARWRWPLIAIAIAAGIVMAFAPMPSNWNPAFDNPAYAYVWWWHAMPATCWGLAFAWFMTSGPIAYGVSETLGFGGIALALICCTRQVFVGIEGVSRGLSGLGCALAALAPWRGSAISWLARFGRYGYGIYLCHVLFVEGFRAIAARLHIASSAGMDLVNFLLSFGGSMLLVIALGRSRRLAWLNG